MRRSPSTNVLVFPCLASLPLLLPVWLEQLLTYLFRRCSGVVREEPRRRSRGLCGGGEEWLGHGLLGRWHQLQIYYKVFGQMMRSFFGKVKCRRMSPWLKLQCFLHHVNWFTVTSASIRYASTSWVAVHESPAMLAVSPHTHPYPLFSMADMGRGRGWKGGSSCSRVVPWNLCCWIEVPGGFHDGKLRCMVLSSCRFDSTQSRITRSALYFFSCVVLEVAQWQWLFVGDKTPWVGDRKDSTSQEVATKRKGKKGGGGSREDGR